MVQADRSTPDKLLNEYQELADIHIRCNDGDETVEIPANRCVLAAASDVFAYKFVRERPVKRKTVFDFPYSSLVVKELLRHIYTHRPWNTPVKFDDNALELHEFEELRDGARQYGLPWLEMGAAASAYRKKHGLQRVDEFLSLEMHVDDEDHPYDETPANDSSSSTESSQHSRDKQVSSFDTTPVTNDKKAFPSKATATLAIRKIVASPRLRKYTHVIGRARQHPFMPPWLLFWTYHVGRAERRGINFGNGCRLDLSNGEVTFFSQEYNA